MRLWSHVVVPIALIVLVLAAGCGAPSSETAVAEPVVRDPGESQSVVPFVSPVLPEGSEMRRDKTRGTVRFLKGANLSAALDDDPDFREQRRAGRFDRLALMFIDRHRSDFRLQDPPSELRVLSQQTDGLGLTHVKLQQQYAGLAVAEAQLIVHLNENAQVYLVNGSYLPTPSEVETVPVLDVEAARQAAAREIGIDDCADCPAELIISAAEDGTARLAYRVYAAASLTRRWEIMVAAADGEILRKLPTVLQSTGPMPIGLTTE